jgi:hypothetical protein
VGAADAVEVSACIRSLAAAGADTVVLQPIDESLDPVDLIRFTTSLGV